MASKRKLHHILVRLRQIKTWQLLLLLLVSTLLAAFLLRQNNLQMVSLRNKVMQVDESNGDVKSALTDLQKYVSAHMNTSLGNGIYLQNTYQRAYEAAVQAAATATNPQAALYTQVELECRPIYQRTHSFPAYTQCAHDKLSQLAPGQDPLASLKTPDVELYHYNFVSPLLSFDAAGFFVLLALVVTVVIVVRAVAYGTLKLLLRAKKTRI